MYSEILQVSSLFNVTLKKGKNKSCRDWRENTRCNFSHMHLIVELVVTSRSFNANQVHEIDSGFKKLLYYIWAFS